MAADPRRLEQTPQPRARCGALPSSGLGAASLHSPGGVLAALPGSLALRSRCRRRCQRLEARAGSPLSGVRALRGHSPTHGPISLRPRPARPRAPPRPAPASAPLDSSPLSGPSPTPPRPPPVSSLPLSSPSWLPSQQLLPRNNFFTVQIKNAIHFLTTLL